MHIDILFTNMNGKSIPLELFLKVDPNQKNTDLIKQIDIIDVQIIYGLSNSRPLEITDQYEINEYKEAHIKSSGNGNKSNIVDNISVVSTCLSAGKAVFAATGVLSLCTWAAGSYITSVTSSVVKDHVINKSIKHRNFLKHESVQLAYNKLDILLLCNINHKQSYIDQLSKIYISNYITSSDSSRSIEEKFKSTDYDETIRHLMYYLYELSHINKNLYKNNGKRLFVAIVDLAFDIKFKIKIIKK